MFGRFSTKNKFEEKTMFVNRISKNKMKQNKKPSHYNERKKMRFKCKILHFSSKVKWTNTKSINRYDLTFMERTFEVYGQKLTSQE